MPVVTMTGTIASGAREAGRRVANLLGIDLVDQQLLVHAARRCGVPVGVVAERDERYASFLQRVASVLNTLLERSAVTGADPMTGGVGLEAILSQSYADMADDEREEALTDEAYINTMTAVIRELAASGRIVVVGRGSQMILAEMPQALHVLCIAPAELRYQRLAERDGMDLEDARRRGTESDRARTAFYKKFWKVDVEDPRLYDLTIDTSRLSYDAAAEAVAAAARAKSAE
jgi:cytidylate kinase